MKKFLILLAAGAAITTFTPIGSSAEEIYVAPPGIDFRFGEPRRDEWSERREWREDRVYRDRDDRREWRDRDVKLPRENRRWDRDRD